MWWGVWWGLASGCFKHLYLMCNCVELVLKLVQRCLTPSILSAAGQMRRTLTRISPLRSVVLVDEGKTGSNAEMKYSLVRLVKIPTPGVVVFFAGTDFTIKKRMFHPCE